MEINIFFERIEHEILIIKININKTFCENKNTVLMSLQIGSFCKLSTCVKK